MTSDALQQVEHVAGGERAARVAAVGVDEQDLLAVLLGGAVEVDAHRVVERRPAVRLAHADALDQPRVVVGAVARDADLGVEIDQRDVDRVLVGVEELDRGRCATSLMSAAMLPLVSSSEPEVQRRRVVSGSPRGEELDRLRLAVLDDLEVLRLQAGDRRALLVGDDDAEVDEIDAGAERLLLRARAPS